MLLVGMCSAFGNSLLFLGVVPRGSGILAGNECSGAALLRAALGMVAPVGGNLVFTNWNGATRNNMGDS